MKILKKRQYKTQHINSNLQTLKGRARALHTVEWFSKGKSELEIDNEK